MLAWARSPFVVDLDGPASSGTLWYRVWPMSPTSKFASLLALVVLCSLASVSHGTFLGIIGQTEVQALTQEQPSREMSENATMIAPFGMECRTTELQSHARHALGSHWWAPWRTLRSLSMQATSSWAAPQPAPQAVPSATVHRSQDA